MHPSLCLYQIIKVLLLLAISSPQLAHANESRKDLCGVSIHTTDLPDIHGFQSVEATWTVPEVALAPEGSEPDAIYTTHGVALCCGADCSTRLAAGVQTRPRYFELPETASPIFQLDPGFGQVMVPYDQGIRG